MKHLQPGSNLYQAIEGPFSKLVKRSRWPLTCETSRSRMSGSSLTSCHWKVSNQELQETIKHTFCRSRNLIQLQTPRHKTSLATHGSDQGILGPWDTLTRGCSMHVFTPVLSWGLGILWQGVQYACVHASTVLGWSEYFRTYDLVWYNSHIFEFLCHLMASLDIPRPPLALPWMVTS